MVAKDFDGNDGYIVIDDKSGKGVSVLSQASRVWMLIVNNPADYGVTVDSVASILQEACNKGIITYWACNMERSLEANAETGSPTPHMHIVIYFPGKQRGGWLHKRFPHAALFPCAASVPSTVLYIRKDTRGEWYKKHPEKLGEKLPDSEAGYYEWGDMPGGLRAEAGRTKSERIVAAIAEGMSDSDLLVQEPDLWQRLPAIRQTRTVVTGEKYLREYRPMDVTYIEGPTGTGKTRYVMQHTNYDLFVVDDYDHPWDGYEQQKVVFFDEFREQATLSDMLRWLDGNPTKLKARYANAVACYTTVYIASNWPLEEQYKYVQKDRPRDWAALLRRIHHRRIYEMDGSYQDYDNDHGKWVLHT